MLILTCGVNGSYVFTPGEVSFIETPRVEVADTVGAGDSFTGAFVASILKGKSVREAHELAVKVSAYVCTQHGAMPVLPDTRRAGSVMSTCYANDNQLYFPVFYLRMMRR